MKLPHSFGIDCIHCWLQIIVHETIKDTNSVRNCLYRMACLKLSSIIFAHLPLLHELHEARQISCVLFADHSVLDVDFS